MPKRFYKYKLLLDEHLPPRQRLAHLNERFNVKHIKHDLRAGGMDDAPIHELALAQQRIILTSNVKDFRRLLGEDSPGVISIPEAWSGRAARYQAHGTAHQAKPGLLPRSGAWARLRGGCGGSVSWPGNLCG